MVPFIAASAAPIAPLGSPNASKLHSTRPRCWTHLPKQVVQVTAGFLQGRAFCRNARAESLCVIQSTCTRAGRGTYACERACWLAEPGRPGGKQWGFGAANPPESIPAHRPALPAAISHRTLAASSSTQSQCTRERSKLKSSSFPFPQRSSLPFSRSRIRIAWRVAAVNVPFSMPCSRIVRQPYINERKRVDPRSPSASIASVSIGEQPFSELSERIT